MRRGAVPGGAALLAALGASLAAGCLEPRVSDEPGLPGLVLPAGSEVPSAHDVTAIERQISGADGVGALVARLHGFAGGEAIVYWDFGPAPAFAAPGFRLIRSSGDEIELIDHPVIVDAIPGEPDYSPFLAVFDVPVTDLYRGEVLTSLAAVQEAVALGLVLRPEQTDRAINAPIVAEGVELQTGDAGSEELPPSTPPPAIVYWDGMSVSAHDFGEFEIADSSSVRIDSRYILRRAGGEPINEGIRGVDLTSDGDRLDTNDVFGTSPPLPPEPSDPDYSPLCRTVAVALSDAAPTIDETPAPDDPIDTEGELFTGADRTPNKETVVAFEVTDDLRNVPRAREEAP